MKKYNRVMLGRGSKYAKTCHENGYIGANFDINIDLSDFLYDNWRDFNAKFIPIWMENVPGKSKTDLYLCQSWRRCIHSHDRFWRTCCLVLALLDCTFS